MTASARQKRSSWTRLARRKFLQWKRKPFARRSSSAVSGNEYAASMKAKVPNRRKEALPSDKKHGTPQDNGTPPNQFQPGNRFAWQKVQSRNLAGRPVTTDIKAEAREFLSECDDPKTVKARLRVLCEIDQR